MGMRIKVMMVRRQLALNMNTNTIVAWVSERRPTFRFRQIWSDTVVVSADSLLVISPAEYNRHQCDIQALCVCNVLIVYSRARACIK